jgi:hypothetical protein
MARTPASRNTANDGDPTNIGHDSTSSIITRSPHFIASAIAADSTDATPWGDKDLEKPFGWLETISGPVLLA